MKECIKVPSKIEALIEQKLGTSLESQKVFEAQSFEWTTFSEEAECLRATNIPHQKFLGLTNDV